MYQQTHDNGTRSFREVNSVFDSSSSLGMIAMVLFERINGNYFLSQLRSWPSRSRFKNGPSLKVNTVRVQLSGIDN